MTRSLKGVQYGTNCLASALRKIGNKEPINVLDFACGSGTVSLPLAAGLLKISGAVWL